MGVSVEFFAAAHSLDPAAPADWTFGEDVIASQSPAPGYRSLAEPRLDGSLDHYSELGVSTAPHDRGTIAGHAFYLAAEGGTNSGCTPSASRPATHAADCAVDVPALGNVRATQIFYEAFTGLHETAGFCDARNASVAVAGAEADAVSLAWEAVGLHADCVATEPPPPPACSDVPDATIPFSSPHPYEDGLNCTWTYDNGTPGFAFHFSAMDVEFDYDFVYVIDGDGNYLAGYTGSFPPDDIPFACIPTSTGSVQLVSDGSVTAYGFDVDGVVPC